MYGLEAINANNGWAICVVGISIVFSGLVSLSLVISQLHKVLALYENPSKIKAFFKTKKTQKQVEDGQDTFVDLVLTQSQKEVSKQFALLVRTMEDHFSLPRLLHLAKISGLKDPYSNLNNLLKIGIVIPDGEGFFTLNNDRFAQFIE